MSRTSGAGLYASTKQSVFLIARLYLLHAAPLVSSPNEHNSGDKTSRTGKSKQVCRMLL